jgi:hypothetical protein
MLMEPVAALLAPVLIATAPEEPTSASAFAVLNAISPLPVSTFVPVVMLTVPPRARSDVDEPAKIDTLPAAPAAAPARNWTLPDDPVPLLPEATTISPEGPEVAEPDVNDN